MTNVRGSRCITSTGLKVDSRKQGKETKEEKKKKEKKKYRAQSHGTTWISDLSKTCIKNITHCGSAQANQPTQSTNPRHIHYAVIYHPTCMRSITQPIVLVARKVCEPPCLPNPPPLSLVCLCSVPLPYGWFCRSPTVARQSSSPRCHDAA